MNANVESRYVRRVLGRFMRQLMEDRGLSEKQRKVISDGINASTISLNHLLCGDDLSFLEAIEIVDASVAAHLELKKLLIETAATEGIAIPEKKLTLFFRVKIA